MLCTGLIFFLCSWISDAKSACFRNNSCKDCCYSDVQWRKTEGVVTNRTTIMTCVIFMKSWNTESGQANTIILQSRKDACTTPRKQNCLVKYLHHQFYVHWVHVECQELNECLPSVVDGMGSAYICAFHNYLQQKQCTQNSCLLENYSSLQFRKMGRSFTSYQGVERESLTLVSNRTCV